MYSTFCNTQQERKRSRVGCTRFAENSCFDSRTEHNAVANSRINRNAVLLALSAYLLQADDIVISGANSLRDPLHSLRCQRHIVAHTNLSRKQAETGQNELSAHEVRHHGHVEGADGEHELALVFRLPRAKRVLLMQPRLQRVRAV